MTINTQSTVGTVAAEYPLATRVFARHDIDYCCGGGRPLGEVCAKKGLDAQNVIAEIEKEIASTPFAPQRWDTAPLNDVIDHILAAYHRPQLEEIRRLEGMVRKVVSVHGDKDPARLNELQRVYLALEDELLDHFAKEEQILFPMIRRGQGATADGPVAVMLQEHDDAGAALRSLRELTDGYQPPAEACTTWRALYHGLAVFEEQLHQHIHIENNILFPRALQG
ncbi:MAG TPA: iron-sulfur cluster repair di-iron protein [Candidatus Krumholzibacteria bacterium]